MMHTTMRLMPAEGFTPIGPSAPESTVVHRPKVEA